MTNMPTGIWELILASDLVKIGTHPEDGEDIIRELWYIQAINTAGRRFRHQALATQAEAEERLALLVLDGGVDPVRSDGWDETYPVYGSVEYQLQEPELVAAERREIEAEPIPLWVKQAEAARRKGEVRR
jgi:hypothetical protein